MLPDDAPELAHCHATLLPIWETWMDGDPAVRRALECLSADPASHRERLGRLFLNVWRLLRLEDSDDTDTALQAGWAVLLALGAEAGELGEGWWELCAEAEAAHQQALARLGRG